MQNYFRLFLFPFAILYGIAVWLRNKLYDFGISKQYKAPIKTICVGNLSTGGTGKTPHTQYIAKYIDSLNIVPAILSRGYGRKSKGFLEVTKQSTATQVGDEPLQIKYSLPTNAKNFVCENRAVGIKKIMESNSNIECIILDDAYQHRAVKCGLNILLTEASKLFTDDFLLPVGNLRESKTEIKRANLVVVTNTKPHHNKTEIQQKVSNYFMGEIVFSSIKYLQKLFHWNNQNVIIINDVINYEILVYTGIANASNFLEHISSFKKPEHVFTFTDHHILTKTEVQKIVDTFTSITKNKIIITTEKDVMRMKNNSDFSVFNSLPLFYLPIEITFDKNDEIKFKKIVENYVRSN